MYTLLKKRQENKSTLQDKTWVEIVIALQVRLISFPLVWQTAVNMHETTQDSAYTTVYTASHSDYFKH